MTPAEQFRLLVGLSLVDGSLQPSEEEILMRAAHQLGLEQEEAHGIVGEISQGGRVANLKPPSSPTERDRLFKMLVSLAAADGVITPQEQGVLQRLAGPFGVHPGRVPTMLQSALATVAGAAIAGGAVAGGAVAGGGAAPAPAPPPVPAPEQPSGVRLRRPTGKQAAKPRPQHKTGSASCPSCGAPVEFRNTRSVALVCEYCDTTVARTDAGDALREVGKVSHIVADASPIQIGSNGTCYGVGFSVIGRLQVEHATGYWNEWFLEWADKRTGWLGEALGQYYVTFPSAGEGDPPFVPLFEELEVGHKIKIEGKRYTITEVRVARATGTEGETPFMIEEGYELPYADLRRSDAGFATIDYSEERPLVFTGRCVDWPDLNLRNYRRFDGWRD